MELQLFYEEPDEDRWILLDRYPRRLIRRVLRGKAYAGGHKRTFLNLCAGLDQINQPYRVNDYLYAQKHPTEVAGIIGKAQLLYNKKWRNPLVIGPCTHSHPCDTPDLLNRVPVKRILVYGEWMRKMCEPYWGNQVATWPVGIDTDKWNLSSKGKDIDILLYCKVMWKHDKNENELIEPIQNLLRQKRMKTEVIRYGFYKEDEFYSLIARSRAMIFLCEHETQGIAYQQALSCGVPILAWDMGSYWLDPSYYPHKVKFAPVSSVPYWDERCGVKFKDMNEFPEKLEEFLDKQARQEFSPRDYIMETLTLEKCAKEYVRLYKEVQTAQ